MTGLANTSVTYLTAGAGGMFCGSCLHDNALAKALTADGWNVQLVPIYTPIRTDETDVSIDHVLFGGLNVYLQQKIPLFRYLPMWLDAVLDRPGLIRRVTARAMDTDAATLGGLTHSMLLGLQGNQRKEVRRMVQWLKSQSPDLIVFSNLLIGGSIQAIKEQLAAPIIVTLQGDDVFLDGLQEPWRSKCMARLREVASHVDAFIVHSDFFRDYMAEYFSIPIQKIHVTPLGIDTTDFQATEPPATKITPEQNDLLTIGYLARIAPEKGLMNLVDALLLLCPADRAKIQLRVAGWLGPENETYAAAAWSKLDAAGWSDNYEYLGAIERDAKLALLRTLDLFCVPTQYQEPKGLYALEALAAGVPIVASQHGAFPELIDASGGGLLTSPNDPRSLAATLSQLINDPNHRVKLAESGRSYVFENRDASHMAASTGAVFRTILAR